MYQLSFKSHLQMIYKGWGSLPKPFEITFWAAPKLVMVASNHGLIEYKKIYYTKWYKRYFNMICDHKSQMYSGVLVLR